MEETKEVLQIRNKEVEGRGKADAREVGRVAAEATTKGYGKRQEHNEQIKVHKFHHVIMKVVLGFCKNKMFPINKFLEQSMLIYSLSNKKNLCFKLTRLIAKLHELNTSIDHDFFWSNHTVPMINKEYVELRSNFNTEVKRVYLGEFKDVTYQSF